MALPRGAYSLPARRVVETLEKLRLQGRLPAELRIDNGPRIYQRLVGGLVQNPWREAQLHRTRQAPTTNGHYFVDEQDAQPKCWRFDGLLRTPADVDALKRFASERLRTGIGV